MQIKVVAETQFGFKRQLAVFGECSLDDVSDDVYPVAIERNDDGSIEITVNLSGFGTHAYELHITLKP